MSSQGVVGTEGSVVDTGCLVVQGQTSGLGISGFGGFGVLGVLGFWGIVGLVWT